MKLFITKVPPKDAQCKVGEWLPITASAQQDELMELGYEFQTEGEYNAVKATEAAEKRANENAVKARETLVDSAIQAARDKGVFAPKENTDAVRAEALEMEGYKPGMGVKFIADKQPVQAKNDTLRDRMVSGSGEVVRVEVVSEGVREQVKNFIDASEPFMKTTRNGGILSAVNRSETGIQDAIMASRTRGRIMAKLIKAIESGADFRLADMVQGAQGDTGTGDYHDPAANSPLGTLNSTLVLTWNLGFLKNQLMMLKDIVTDISNQPVAFGQMAKTRYIQVPKYQKKTATTAWSTGQTGSTVDVNIAMSNYNGVPIALPETVLSATVRQIHNEMKTPQLYSLGESLIYNIVNTIINGSSRIVNAGTSAATVKFGNVAEGGTARGVAAFNVSGATLATFTADIPAYMNLAKIMGGDEKPNEEPQRFAWLHTSVYANIAASEQHALLLTVQQSLGKTGGNFLQTGQVERLGNLKINQSQLIRDGLTEDATVVTDIIGGGTPNLYAVGVPATSPDSVLGFAGTRNSLLFCSRVPTDYTKVMPEIPNTAAVELITEPETGITFMVVKFLDHAYEVSHLRVALMFGTAVGDEGQGVILKKG